MFIQTENTPNPLTVKFLPGRAVMEVGVAEFKTIDQAAASPLAQQLFQLGEITNVFFGSDFISVSKDEKAKWDALKTRIMAVTPSASHSFTKAKRLKISMARKTMMMS